MEKQRIQVYADPEIKRRIELAAAKYNVPVTEYCLNAIQQQLADDNLLEEAQVEITVTPTKQNNDSLIADLRALHQEILAYREGEWIDVDAELEKMREERGYELTGLR
jgi:uncharacterized protein (DUF1778 family)